MGTAVIPPLDQEPRPHSADFRHPGRQRPRPHHTGLGAWWEPLATNVGVKRERAIRAMAEVVESVRLLLKRDAPRDVPGRVRPPGGRVPGPRRHGGHHVKIFVAAVGPQMLRLAGRIADGVILNSNHTVAATRRAVEEIRKGAEAAGRSMDSIERVKPLPLRVNGTGRPPWTSTSRASPVHRPAAPRGRPHRGRPGAGLQA